MLHLHVLLLLILLRALQHREEVAVHGRDRIHPTKYLVEQNHVSSEY